MDVLLSAVGSLGIILVITLLLSNPAKKNTLKIAAIMVAVFFLFMVGCGIEDENGADNGAPGNQTGVEDGLNGIDETDETTDPGDPDKPGDSEGGSEPALPSAPAGQLTVHFIDVGQGDAILVQTPEQNILIDGGDRGDTVLNYLKNKGVSSLDLIIATHPHADHIGGLINVLRHFPVKEVIDPGVPHTTRTFEDYLGLIDQKDIKFTEGRAGMSRDLGSGAMMQILHPSDPCASHLNDASIVTRISFEQVSFMLTGDAEQAAEDQILSSGNDIQSIILKVGHHGSSTSTTLPFLSAVNPVAAVIMCGTDNRYGHPHAETLQILTAAGVDIYRTDLQGSIIITTDGKTYHINKQPYLYKPGTTDQEPEPAPAPDKVNLNTASLGQLQDIVHIGPSRAQEIINLRPINSLDDLTKISGIGPATLQDIKDQGLAYVK